MTATVQQPVRDPLKPPRSPWTWGIPLAVLLIAVGSAALVWYAADAIVNSTDGTLEETVTDPAAPGYEAIVEPSPSHLVLGLDPEGHLATVALLALASNDLGGALLLLPADTIVEDKTLAEVYDDKGEGGTRKALATLTDLNVDDLTTLEADGWSQLVAPAGALEIELADDLVRVVDDVTEVVYPAGNVSLQPEQVSEFLGWLNPGEPQFNRFTRQASFWEAWIGAIGAADATVPGEVSSGLGRFLVGLGRGPFREFEASSAVDTVLEDDRRGLLLPQAEVRQLAAEMIPFPRPADAGARPQVRLLDGVGGVDVVSLYAADLIAAGAHIVLVGNAGTFDVERSVVIYHSESRAEIAQDLAESVQAEVRLEPIEDAVIDITVIIGADQELALG